VISLSFGETRMTKICSWRLKTAHSSINSGEAAIGYILANVDRRADEGSVKPKKGK
jgi:hypothetical protein